VFLVFRGYPLVYALRISFYRWLGIGEPKWIGLGNYTRLLKSAKTWGALENTLFLAAVLLPTILVASLVLAALLNSDKTRGRSVIRLAYFLPYVTSAVIAVIVFSILLNEDHGMINKLLQAVGLPSVRWLKDPGPARISVVLMVFWMNCGYYVLIMTGGLQGIPEDLYDAASVDGASSVQQFLYVTVPQMRGVIVFVAMTLTILLLNLFTEPWLLFTRGGGPKQSVMTLTQLLFIKAFRENRFSEASALGFLGGALVVVVAFIQFRIASRDES
jgi:lactose/L-arabinose transport system permease protein